MVELGGSGEQPVPFEHTRPLAHCLVLACLVLAGRPAHARCRPHASRALRLAFAHCLAHAPRSRTPSCGCTLSRAHAVSHVVPPRARSRLALARRPGRSPFGVDAVPSSVLSRARMPSHAPRLAHTRRLSHAARTSTVSRLRYVSPPPREISRARLSPSGLACCCRVESNVT